MSYRAAIIGLPFSGKTTVMQAACQLSPDHVHSAGRLGEHVGVMKLSGDNRLAWLGELYGSKKMTPVCLELWDFPGFDLTSEQSRQKCRQVWGEVRQCDLLIVVVRAFDNPAVPDYRGRVDPAADIEELIGEFVFADMDQLTRRIEKLQAQLRKPSASHDSEKRELELLGRCLSALEGEKGLDGLAGNADEQGMLRSFALLTSRRSVIVINANEDELDREYTIEPYAAVRGKLTCAGEYERQLLELPDDQRGAFLAEVGLSRSLCDRLAETVIDAMGLIVFYTAGPNEARAWVVPAGISAVDAAGKIHSDMARGFIRAETVAFDELHACGSYKQARSEGKVRQEGKGYTVQDGDVILFRFNV